MKKLSDIQGFTLKRFILEQWPLSIALLTLWVIVSVCLSSALSHTNGHLIYALDDAYIHMAMAKNLAQHGIYGVTQYEFSSSSSSPLWTLLLAFMYVLFGVREWLPFFLNLVFASAILVVVNKLFRTVSSNPILCTVLLIAFVLFTPMPAMIFTGMEHLLQILLVLVRVWVFSCIIVEKEFLGRTLHMGKLILLIVAVTMARFEGYAILFIGCMFLLVRGRWKTAAGIALAGVIPLLLYQCISVWKGWFWLPNSILIRTDAAQSEMFNSQQTVVVHSILGGFSSFFKNFMKNLPVAHHIAALVVGASILFMVGWIQKKTLWTMVNILLIQFILIALVHLQFGKCGHFFRYEAYLVALGLFVIVVALADLFQRLSWKPFTWRKIVGGLLVFMFLFLGALPLYYRCKNSIMLIPWACRNIYEQQYQMGLFVKLFYPGASIAANDIGALSFLGDVSLLDLVGLASVDVLKLKNDGLYTTDQIRLLSTKKDVSLAIVYDAWFHLENLRGIPSEWIKVGEWKIGHNVVCGGDVVSFYAVKPGAKEQLINNLRFYSYLLPRSVEQGGLYTDRDISFNTFME
jgi:hypothetical protein